MSSLQVPINQISAYVFFFLVMSRRWNITDSSIRLFANYFPSVYEKNEDIENRNESPLLKNHSLNLNTWYISEV